MFGCLQKIRPIYKIFLIFFIGAIVGLGGAISAIYLSPLKWITFIEPSTKDVQAMSFWEEYQKAPDDFLFLDVRSKKEYEVAHAKGSINEPIANLFHDHEVLPKRNKTIVLICSSGRLAGVAYGYLERQGFLNLRRIEGGLNQWKEAGLPIEGEPSLIPLQD